MNEYLKAFQDVTHSTQQLLANEYHSLESIEIKQSAASLEKTVEPCIQELKLSAAKLKATLQACLDNLEHSQDVWESKSRIASVPQTDVWQNLGDISGCHFRIQRLCEHYKQVAVEEAKDAWRQRIESLTNKYFFDQKRQRKKGIGYDDKNGFLRDINPEIDSQAIKLNQTISKYLKVILQNFDINHLELNFAHFKVLNRQEKKDWQNKTSKTVKEVRSSFNDPTKIFNNCYSLGLRDACQLTLDGWRKTWGDITWEQVVKFEEEIAKKIEKRITSLFEDRLELIKKALEQTILFYDSFLLQQERYQQETPIQRQAEKAWIEQQYQKLVKIQVGLEALLN